MIERVVRCEQCRQPFIQKDRYHSSWNEGWIATTKPRCGSCKSLNAARRHRDMAADADQAAVTKRLSQQRGVERARSLAQKRGVAFEIVEWAPPPEVKLAGEEP